MDLPDLPVGVLLEQFMGWWRTSNEARRHVALNAFRSSHGPVQPVQSPHPAVQVSTSSPD